jgi:hypothetical protein
MTLSDAEITEQARKKRTIWLMAGGAASLLIPLIGVVYLHWNAAGTQGPSGRNDVFERREGGERRIIPSQTAVPSALLTPPPSSLPIPGRIEVAVGSSLDFVKSNQEMTVKAAAAPAAPAQAAPPPIAAPAMAVAPAKEAKAKKGKKEFAMPKLQPSRGFTKMGGGGNAAPAKAPAQGGGGNVQDIMGNLPPGAANNPQVQEYLKNRGGR